MGKQTVVVIGAGPAGLMAAATASRRGKHTILLEKNQQQGIVFVGKKLLITGNGRCNVTNDRDTKGLIANVPTNGPFLYRAFQSFTPQDTIALLEQYGVKTKREDNGRVLPQSNRSKDVVDALRRYAEDQGVLIRIGQVQKVNKLLSDRFAIEYVENDRKILLETETVIIATGGKSYPQTGSTGDGYRFAESVGHQITPCKASLVPMETKETWVKDLQGVSLRNVNISLVEMDSSPHQGTQMANNKTVFREKGDLLFTHYGITGPSIFSASAHLGDMVTKTYCVWIDILPDMSDKELEKRLLDKLNEYGKKQLGNLLQDFLPKKLILTLLKRVDVRPETLSNQITQLERKRVVGIMKRFPLTVKRMRSIEEATITSGGIAVNEIDPKTMESKIVNGLYFAGEVIDTDGYTGGFNIQIALSTGYLAGKRC